MTRDLFALMGLPRRPWLDQEEVHRRFLELSNRVHPDRAQALGKEEPEAMDFSFADLNRAYTVLRDPALRALHLLELEAGRPPEEVQEIPHETTDWFLRVGTLCRRADQALKRRRGLESPLLKARQFMENQVLVDELNDCVEALRGWGEALLAEERRLNEFWERNEAGEAGAKPLRELERCYRLWSYQARWMGQLQERAFQLAS